MRICEKQWNMPSSQVGCSDLSCRMLRTGRKLVLSIIQKYGHMHVTLLIPYTHNIILYPPNLVLCASNPIRRASISSYKCPIVVHVHVELSTEKKNNAWKSAICQGGGGGRSLHKPVVSHGGGGGGERKRVCG